MLKVLLSAYACNPEQGSEPRIGWNWAVQAARYHEVWAVTLSENRDAIQRAMRAHPNPRLHFVYHDLPGWERPDAGSLAVYLHALLWQLHAIGVCRRLHREIRFDVTHHATYVSYHYPSCLAWLDCPFIWGPVGGCLRAPLAFYPSFGWKGMLAELVRDVFNLTVIRSPLVFWTMWRATCIIPTTEVSKQVLPAWTHPKSVVFRGEGLALDDPPTDRSGSTHVRGLKVLFVGRLLHWKGVHLALDAFAQYLDEDPAAHLTIQMDGPDRSRLEARARRLGIDTKVTFDVTSTIKDVQRMYDTHDVFIFPSLHDSGSFVTLEAMSRGLPVICLNLGGPAHSVTDGVGIRIDARTPSQASRDMAAALARLAADPGLRLRMGTAGRARIAKAFDWDTKGDLLRDLYAAVVATRAADLDQLRARTVQMMGTEGV